MTAYSNENDQGAAAWLRHLIEAGHIEAGDVDERSIADVQPDDLAGYDQCHFFAGLGGWAYACRLAGWQGSRPIWTGSPPCQPYSKAGKQRGASDDRDLWPHLFRLASSCRPAVIMGEQVAAAVGKDWLDRVHADMAGIGYACGAVVVPACAVNAPHRRDRLWFVANPIRAGLAQRVGHAGVSGSVAVAVERQDPADDAVAVADTHGGGRRPRPDDAPPRHREAASTEGRRGAWDGAGWIAGYDGKARRVEPGIRLLDHGVAGRMAVVRPGHGAEAADQEESLHWYSRTNALKCLGNAIVPQVAAEVIGAYMDEHPW